MRAASGEYSRESAGDEREKYISAKSIGSHIDGINEICACKADSRRRGEELCGIRDEIRRAHERDREARDKLVDKNIGLIWSIVRRFSDRGYDREELFQVGAIGLLKAIDHFDLTYEVRFSTYAVPVITGEIRRFLRDDGMLKVSRNLKQQAAVLNRAAQEWRDTNGREASLEELSAVTGISADDIILALSANTEVDSLYRPLPGTGREITLEEQIRDEKNEIEMRINHVFLEQALSGLRKEERQLISLRYFQGKTQTETAKMLGMTQVQVSRKEKQLLIKIRSLV